MKSRMMTVYLALAATMVLLPACQKEVGVNSTSDHFIRTYGNGANYRDNDYGWSDVIQTSDGNLLTAGTVYLIDSPAYVYLSVLKTDDKGNEIWNRFIPMNDSLRFAQVRTVALTEFPNGNILITSRSNDAVICLDPAGKLLAKKLVLPEFENPVTFYYEWTSPPVWGDDGQLYMSTATHQRLDHQLWTIDDLGNITEVDHWEENPLWFTNVLKVNGDTAWYSAGWIPFSGGSYVISAAKRPGQNAFKVVSLSTPLQIQQYREDPMGIYGTGIATSDRLVIIGKPLSLIQGQYYPDNIGFRLAIYDLEYNEIFKGYIEDPIYSMDPEAIAEVNGGYVICGQARTGSGDQSPFVMKVNEQGKVLYRNFNFEQGLRFFNIVETTDGDLVVCGMAKRLGLGQTQSNNPMLLAKLGPNGELD